MAEPAVEQQMDDTVTPMQTEQQPQPVSKLRAMSKLAQASAANTSGGGRQLPARRGVERYNSGGMSGSRRSGGGPSRRSAPRRTQSNRIGRPAFSAASQDVPRTVNRTSSGMFTRAAPLRTGSFQRNVPNRSQSSNSLRGSRGKHHARTGGGTPGIAGVGLIVGATSTATTKSTDDDGDSVFTSASNQTLDSVMLRKRQIKSTPEDGANVIVSGVPAVATLRRDRRLQQQQQHPGSSVASSSFDIDESLHTVDSIPVHMRHLRQQQQQAGDGTEQSCDLSVFSESFVSSDTYMLSDYEEDEDEKFEHLREDDEDDDETFEQLHEE
mmetsp:Transcript_7518/g.21963  ORF Transcript_7518/g.21963 Transcript_7518/m.21963 type:complete len:325 (+) Transcript_7518:517-1491(+)|eukprot:CAMPEP_0119554718 /NCGR_PEP_ID=MMETSP1352-20130426/7116_1 /TAXON_ID=265584 /ORGANISM="Stauroneis constricta, Strain CCMP1120" /LENGTH=324 /DNA_ID=CAMNT_0007601341 /DNA_START=502 /DNA_END=1476 /DNA_ORIENTATION=+